jgi:hypothetical protein
MINVNAAAAATCGHKKYTNKINSRAGMFFCCPCGLAMIKFVKLLVPVVIAKILFILHPPPGVVAIFYLL